MPVGSLPPVLPSLPPLPCLGPLALAGRFTLAPLAGYTNLAFRRCVRDLGGLGLATTDLVNARSVLEGSRKSLELLATAPDDRPLAVQLFGSSPQEMSDAARWIVENLGVAAIDINMGCPVRKVVRTGGGSAMMCDAGSATALVRRVVGAVHVPVTVKMRLGWDDDNHSAPVLAKLFEQEGVAGVTIHGRTREQGFSGGVNRAGIRAVVEAVERIPVFGNGDVRNVAEAAQMLTETGCAGIAIGRGALLNPWIFGQLERWLATGDTGPAATYDMRLDFMARHFRELVAWRGEHLGCLQFRKVAGWYSKTLRVPKRIHSEMMMLATPAGFEALLLELRERGQPPHWQTLGADQPSLAVPSGPISHW